MFGPLQLLGAGAHSAKRGHDFPPHRHTCWELVFYREGHIEMPVGDEVFLTRPGLLLLTPPGVTHSERALTAYSNYFVSLEVPSERAWPRVVSDDSRGSLGYLFRALVEEFGSGSLRPEQFEPTQPTMTSLLLAQLDLFLHQARTAVSLSPASVWSVKPNASSRRTFLRRFPSRTLRPAWEWRPP